MRDKADKLKPHDELALRAVWGNNQIVRRESLRLYFSTFHVGERIDGDYAEGWANLLGQPDPWDNTSEQIAYPRAVQEFERIRCAHSQDDSHWLIIRKGDFRLIGYVFMNRAAHDFRVTVGAIMDKSPDLKRQGYGREAGETVLKHCFSGTYPRLANRVETLCCTGNAPVIKLLGQLGMKREGIKEEYRMIDGKPHDVFVYRMLRREYLATFEKPASQ